MHKQWKEMGIHVPTKQMHDTLNYYMVFSWDILSDNKDK